MVFFVERVSCGKQAQKMTERTLASGKCCVAHLNRVAVTHPASSVDPTCCLMSWVTSPTLFPDGLLLDGALLTCRKGEWPSVWEVGRVPRVTLSF